jgi:S1-C subfamily serine protease
MPANDRSLINSAKRETHPQKLHWVVLNKLLWVSPMRLSINRRAVVSFFLVLAFGAAAADETRGTFGFAAKVDADGFLNPTLKSVLIHSVQPGFPAALAGVTAGDSIVEVDGIKVVGANASVMANRMKKKPGEALILRLARAGGETYVVTLTAIAGKT